MLVAVLGVLVAVFFVATGRGGELSRERPDHAPLDLGPVSSTDVALLRPPTALWGYNVDVTDEALDLIARALRDRDVTIAYLQQQLAERITGTVLDPPGGLRSQPPRPDPQDLRPWSEWRTLPASEDPVAERGPADSGDAANPASPADRSDAANPAGPAAPADSGDAANPAGLADSGGAASQQDLSAEDDLGWWDKPADEGPGEGPAGHEGPSGEPGQ
jgi:hypothetical protein